MNLRFLRWSFVSLGVFFFVGTSVAQEAKRVLSYKSSFDSYKPYSDEKAANWKAANDEVGRIGGWRAYLKEAQQPDAEASKLPATPAVKPSTVVVPSTKKPANPHATHGDK